MENKKDKEIRKECEKTKTSSSKKRDKELEALRSKQQKANEQEKDMFDIAMEMGGATGV